MKLKSIQMKTNEPFCFMKATLRNLTLTKIYIYKTNIKVSE